MTAQEYNGHKTKGHWNVALWISNDEPIYRFALECIQGAKVTAPERWLTVATYRFMHLYGGNRTPDGFEYTTTRVREALAGLEA